MTVSRPPRRVPFNMTHSWVSQVVQYTSRTDIDVRPSSIVHWSVPEAERGSVPIECLLWFDEHQCLLGILNYYPAGTPYGEDPHDVTLLVHPDHRGQGIGTHLIRKAMAHWPAIDLRKQCYTDAGWAVAKKILEAG